MHENSDLKEKLEHAERDARLRDVIATKPDQTKDIWLSLLVKRQELEAESQPLQEREDFGITSRPLITFGAGKDENDYRREKIDCLNRDIAEITRQLARLGTADETPS
jgi:hypothetical protein